VELLQKLKKVETKKQNIKRFFSAKIFAKERTIVTQKSAKNNATLTKNICTLT
jgi:hypothetical protein